MMYVLLSKYKIHLAIIILFFLEFLQICTVDVCGYIFCIVYLKTILNPNESTEVCFYHEHLN